MRFYKKPKMQNEIYYSLSWNCGMKNWNIQSMDPGFKIQNMYDLRIRSIH